MSNPIKVIHNVESGQVLEVEMSDQEYAAHLQSVRDAEAKIKAEEIAKEAKIAALSKLKALGLTEADLKALGL
jgi:hypothetical protein